MRFACQSCKKTVGQDDIKCKYCGCMLGDVIEVIYPEEEKAQAEKVKRIKERVKKKLQKERKAKQAKNKVRTQQKRKGKDKMKKTNYFLRSIKSKVSAIFFLKNK